MNLREFQNWAIAQKVVGNPTEEQSYKGECVSLIQQYLSKVFNMPFKARGNAKDWAYNIPEGFNKLAANVTLEKGDILVYTTGKFGHMSLVDADNKSLEQNKNGDKIITQGNIRKGYECVLRSQTGVDVGSEYTENKTYTTQVALRVRKGPGVDFEQKQKEELTTDGKKNAYDYDLGVLKPNTKVTLLEEKVINNNEVWGRVPSGWIAFKHEGKQYVK